jgi:ABC-2 type transport system permease protein/sodium transport system permease protein
MPEQAVKHSAIGYTQQSWVTRVIRLTRKELRETLRDRRTIITLVLMPLLLYPLISLVFNQFMLLSAPPGDYATQWNVAIRSDEDFMKLMTMLHVGETWLQEQGEVRKPDPAKTQSQLPDPSKLMQPVIAEPDLKSIIPRIEENLSNRQRMVAMDRPEADVAVTLRYPDEDDRGKITFDVAYMPTSSYGRTLADYVNKRLKAANESLLYRELKSRGGPDRPRIVSSLKSLEAKEESIQIASLIPLILILMTMTGAVYPAIDLTAGERERGTLEALMAAPVPRLGLLIAKYLAVLCVALMTAVVNLTAMTITLQASGLGRVLLGEQGLPVGKVFAVLALLLLFAAFFSAVMLTITSFARSFKEAQAYLIPLVLLALAPGFMSLLPGLKLQGLLAIAPLANIVLLARDVLQHTSAKPTIEPLAAGTAVITTALYALAALGLAAKIFGSDSVLYGSQGSWSDFFRRPAEPQSVATLPQAAMAVAILYPAFFLASGYIGQLQQASLQTQLLYSAFGTVLVFLCIPLVQLSWSHVSLVSGLQLRAPPVLSVVGCLLLGLSLWPFAHELIVISQKIGFSTLSPEQMQELVSKLPDRTAALASVSFAIVLLAYAIAPAVCEEVFFRGLLQNALLQRLPSWGAILISAAVFGVFHISVGGLFIIERVFSSALLGVVLGWVCYRTRSIWPGIVLHVVHNGLLVTMARYKDEIQQNSLIKSLEWNTQGETHLPAGLLVIAGALAVGGIALVWLGSKRPVQSPSRSDVPAAKNVD